MAMDNNGDNHQPAGRPDGGQYAPKAGRNTDDDLETDTGAALGIAGHWLDGQRAAATHAAEGAATPAERAERELKVMERLAVARMRGTYDDDSMHRAMGFAAAIIDARDMLRR